VLVDVELGVASDFFESDCVARDGSDFAEPSELEGDPELEEEPEFEEESDFEAESDEAPSACFAVPELLDPFRLSVR
jgi:hypothetical protein